MIRHWTIRGCDIYIFVGRNKNGDQYLPVSQIIHSGDHLPNTKEQEIILKICLFAASQCFGLASEPIILQEILAYTHYFKQCDWLALSDYSAIFTSQRVKMRELGVLSFFLEKDTCILRKFVVASLSRLLPRVHPQPPRSTSNIFPAPPIFEASSRKQPAQFLRFVDIFILLFTVLSNFLYVLQSATVANTGNPRR